ncbi:C-glycoside deglycosidase beta subunit domain-containing protein [Diaminobutyricibacter sp. McL0608]|uniref:C-glycoside deglycosidase beta subunit domain-containing protein n=1 Tax=Leifsonia sp. McL0608 TaxID=3143537 RepID=UPI0031F2EC71
MIPDRIIEQGTLRTDGRRAAVEVRIPWYRALPASCIADAALAIDGIAAPADSLRWELNGQVRTFAEMRDDTDEWWFPLDSAVLSGDVPIAADDAEHEVSVDLTLYIPYIVIGDDEVLHIEEHDSKNMKAVTA